MSKRPDTGAHAGRRTSTVQLAVVCDDATTRSRDEGACSEGRRPLGWLFHEGPGGRLDPRSQTTDARRR